MKFIAPELESKLKRIRIREHTPSAARLPSCHVLQLFKDELKRNNCKRNSLELFRYTKLAFTFRHPSKIIGKTAARPEARNWRLKITRQAV